MLIQIQFSLTSAILQIYGRIIRFQSACRSATKTRHLDGRGHKTQSGPSVCPVRGAILNEKWEARAGHTVGPLLGPSF